MSAAMRFHGLILASIVLALLSGPAVLAQMPQVPTANIMGIVRDSIGDYVADATITVSNAGTDQTWTAVTDTAGHYLLNGLPVGNYEVSGEKSGFKTKVQGRLALNLAQRVIVNFTIQVAGYVEERSSWPPQNSIIYLPLDLGGPNTAKPPMVIDGRGGSVRIDALPMNPRTYMPLIQPGRSPSG